MRRFYFPAPLQPPTAADNSLNLPSTIQHHWVTVLRANVGDQAVLFDGYGGEYLAELIQIDKKSAQVRLLEFNPDNRSPAYVVTLGLVMSKGDRMDYAIQKATELGVTSIQLLTSERCEMRLKYERDQKKIEHWQAIAIAACEQCGLNLLPPILAPLSLETWCADNTDALKLVLALQQQQSPLAKQLPQRISLLVGAEGGLTEAEIAHSEQHGFARWQLGERVLRTETAPVVALATLHYHASLYA